MMIACLSDNDTVLHHSAQYVGTLMRLLFFNERLLKIEMQTCTCIIGASMIHKAIGNEGGAREKNDRVKETCMVHVSQSF